MNQIGIITALMPEARCLTREPVAPQTVTRLDENICLYVSGMGPERAESAAREMLNYGMEVLVSFGTAGAVAPDIEPGDLVIPESITGFDGSVFTTAKQWRTAVVNRLTDCPCNIYLGKMVDTMRVITTVEDKTDILEQNKNVLAVDMESASIAAVANENEVPCMIIRIISDSSNMVLPDLALKICDAYGRVNILNVLIQAFRHPFQLPQLYRLANGFNRASVTMEWIGNRLKDIF